MLRNSRAPQRIRQRCRDRIVCIDKNTNVTSVQFVMKTDSIRKAAAEAAAAEEAQPMTFWQKLLSLFGWNR